MTIDLTPMYADLRFKNEAAFDEWLENKARKLVAFEDNGQDLTQIWIDDRGEILHANLQTSVWCGKFVNIYKLAAGEFIEMLPIGDGEKSGLFKQMDFLIEEITDL